MPANQVKGSVWDPKSIMEYGFGAGLIKLPAAYRNGIYPPGIISQLDIKGVKAFYPPIKVSAIKKIIPHASKVIESDTGGQDDFLFVATETRKYTFQTVGDLDTVMVVFEKDKTENHYLSGDDDSGFEKNSKISSPLVKGREYLINVRVLYSPGSKTGSFIVS